MAKKSVDQPETHGMIRSEKSNFFFDSTQVDVGWLGG